MFSATAVCPKTVWLRGTEQGSLEYATSVKDSLELIQQARKASFVIQYLTELVGEGLSQPQVFFKPNSDRLQSH
jgi:hypothetical protein